MMLFMCGIRRSMRTSSNITIALHMFFRTSGSSSLAKKNRLPIKDLKSFVNQLITKIFNFLKKVFKFLSFLEAYFDFISASSLSMKIQIMGGTITENLGFKSPLWKVKFFLSFFLFIFKFSIKNCVSLFLIIFEYLVLQIRYH